VKNKKVNIPHHSNSLENDSKLLKLIYALSKSIIYGSFRDDAVSHILVHFIEHGKEISEQIKNLFSKFKEMNSEGLWKYEYDALTQKFSEYLKTESEDSLNQFKNLSSRFAKGHFFGKDQKHIENLVYASIEYTFTDVEANYLFLDGVKKYLSKLTPKIAESILLSYEQNLQVLVDSLPEDCKNTLDLFKKEILKKTSNKKSLTDDVESEPEVPVETNTPMKSTPMRSRKKKSAKRSLKLASDDEKSEGEEASDDEKESNKRKREERQEEDEEEDETQISEDLEFAQKKKKRKI
jgi:hypothetical protein